MERWLDATDFADELSAINSLHDDQRIDTVAGPKSTTLVRLVLRDDPLWSDWHGVLSLMAETDSQPVVPMQ
jgi:hypothetical protein